MSDLESHIESIDKAETIEDAFSYFCSAMLSHGYDKVTYSLVTDHHSLGLPKMHGLATSYPDDWMKYYIENDYINLDPVVQAVKQNFTPFFWEDLMKFGNWSEHSRTLMCQSSEAGMLDGVAIPLFGAPGEIVGVGLAKSNSDKGRDLRVIAEAQFLATHFHQKFRNMLQKKNNVLNYNLTQREKCVLSWAAEGKTNEDIADIIGVSHWTVKEYMKSAYVKLDACDRTHAITKAILLGVISPNIVIATP